MHFAHGFVPPRHSVCAVWPRSGAAADWVAAREKKGSQISLAAATALEIAQHIAGDTGLFRAVCEKDFGESGPNGRPAGPGKTGSKSAILSPAGSSGISVATSRRQKHSGRVAMLASRFRAAVEQVFALFRDPFWKGPKPKSGTVLRVGPMGGGDTRVTL